MPDLLEKETHHYVFQTKMYVGKLIHTRAHTWMEKDQSRVKKGENVYEIDLKHWNSLKADWENYADTIWVVKSHKYPEYMLD